MVGDDEDRDTPTKQDRWDGVCVSDYRSVPLTGTADCRFLTSTTYYLNACVLQNAVYWLPLKAAKSRRVPTILTYVFRRNVWTNQVSLHFFIFSCIQIDEVQSFSYWLLSLPISFYPSPLYIFPWLWWYRSPSQDPVSMVTGCPCPALSRLALLMGLAVKPASLQVPMWYTLSNC